MSKPASFTATLFSAIALYWAVDSTAAEPPPKIGSYDIDIGAGTVYRPAYEGSDQYKLRLMPIARATYFSEYGKISLGGRGLAWSMHLSQKFELGAALGYTMGRKVSSSSELNGLGDIKKSPELGLFTAYHMGPLELRLGAKAATTSESRGDTTVDLGANYRWPIGQKLKLDAGLGATWASGHYMRHYFGVSGEQSVNSGYPEYSPGSGIKNVDAHLSAMYPLTKRWGLLTSVHQGFLLGDAADSPITHKKSQQVVMMGLSYHWQGM